MTAADIARFNSFMAGEGVVAPPPAVVPPPSSVPPAAGDGQRPDDDDDEDAGPAPFPVDVLPPVLRAMAEAQARVDNVPVALAACCCLATVSAAVGPALRLASGPGRTTGANLFLMPVARSGLGKSEACRRAVRPLLDVEREAVQAWEDDVRPRLLASKDFIEAQLSRLRKEAGKDNATLETREQLRARHAELEEVERALVAPVLTVENITTERLAVLMQARGETLFSASADAGEIVANVLGRYADRVDDSLYVKAFSGDPCRVDRMGRAPVVLNRPCLTALWLVQGDKLDALFAERGLVDGGLLARLLVCVCTGKPRLLPLVLDEVGDGFPAAVAGPYAALVRGLLTAFRHEYDTDNTPEPLVVSPTPGAFRLLAEYANEVAGRLAGELADAGAFVARWAEQAFRLGLVLHAAAHGTEAANQKLDEQTAAAAISLGRWFAEQQLGVLSAGREARRGARVGKLVEMLGQHGGELTLYRLADKHGFPAEEVRALAADYPGRLRVERRHTGGRPSEVLVLAKP